MSYDLTNPEDLYNFSNDCEEACCACPQYQPWNPIDFDAGRNEVSPFEVFMYWKENVGGDILFSYGYCADLSEEAKETFNRYTIKANLNDEGKEIESDEIDLSIDKSISKIAMQILTFAEADK